MNPLQTLRPEVVQSLLEKCTSVKVKRVFLYLSEKIELPYFKKLNLKKIDMGKGIRQIASGNVQLSKEKYKRTVDLLLEILPFALKDERVALKGGTAIKLFHRDLPRLSGDIDLCYLLLEDRTTTFKNLHTILANIKDSLEKNLGLTDNVNNPLDGKKETKIAASWKDIEVKIEPNFTLRSRLFPAIDLDLSKKGF